MSISVFETVKQDEELYCNSDRDLCKQSISDDPSICIVECINSSNELQSEEIFFADDLKELDTYHNEVDFNEEDNFEAIKSDEICSDCFCEFKESEISQATPSQEELDNLSSYPLDNFLPCCISNLRIKKLTWNDFSGTPNFDLKWSAHAFWGINYTYTVIQKPAKNKKVSYVIKPEVNVWLKKKSWTKKQIPHLLNHEQGHYILGCFCALEFKKQVLSFSFTDNYRLEIPRLFNQILKQYIYMEKKYDKETNHRMNREKQTEWDNYMLSKLKEYQDFFKKVAVPKNEQKQAKNNS